MMTNYKKGLVVLKRIQTIDNVGNYFKVNAGNISFERITIVYGENRNGKSTLCDILHSLSLNQPQLIIDRKSIIPSKPPSQIEQKVEIRFEGQPKNVKFINNNWDFLPSESSKLYVFDHSFIHRNVMTGTVYTRGNSENISGFILGENAQKFEELEERNQQLRNDRKELSRLKSQFETHGISNIDNFIITPLPVQTIEDINLQIENVEASKETLSIKISNINQVTQRSNIEGLSNHRDIVIDLDNINNCLSSGMESVHEASKAAVDVHKQYIKNPNYFDGWAANGVQHLKDDCPFCGQELEQSAQSLIESYKTAFDNSFQNFISQTKSNITRLQRTTLIKLDIDYIRERNRRNLICLQSYVEDEIKNLLDSEYIPKLSSSLEDVEQKFSELNITYNENARVIKNSLDKKREIPYEAIDSIGFTNLLAKLTAFNDSISQYNTIKDEINTILIQFKGLQNVQVLEEQKRDLDQDKATLIKYKKRAMLDSICVSYSSLKAKIDRDQAAYNTSKATLEAEQEAFLDTYFSKINDLFCRIGSPDFEISRKVNRGGARTVYDLGVTFKGEEISKDKFNCLFSESDRRALALCVFLSKIELLSPNEKKNAILVMDDPVTSFDNERISSILQVLYTLKDTVKQVIVTTHYRGMVSTVIKQFKDAKIVKIVQTDKGSEFKQGTKAEMTATAHDEAYDEIMSFIERKTQDNKITMLRPFLETEIGNRYKLPLKRLGLNESDSFGKCIESLAEHKYISTETAASLNGYKNLLNIPSHELASWSFEDSRAQAQNLMNFIYSDL